MLSVYYVRARLEVSHLFGFDRDGETHPFVPHLRRTPSRAFDVETRQCVRVKVATSVCARACVITGVGRKALARIESEVRKDSTERKKRKEGRKDERKRELNKEGKKEGDYDHVNDGWVEGGGGRGGAGAERLNVSTWLLIQSDYHRLTAPTGRHP